MNGVTFGDLHSFNDLNLILNSKEIGSPAVKTKTIEIEGADSSLDLTEFFGEAKFENVMHKFQFSTIVPQAQFLSLFSAVKNALHGKKMRIALDGDPLFYYIGRIHVSSFTNEKSVGIISIECDCEPYKYKKEKTVAEITVNGTYTTTIPNSRKRVVPEVKVETSGTINIVYGEGNVWDLGSGTYTLPELELVEGENTVTVTGTGTITFTYQEGSL
jgi:phage-related protein